MHEMAIAASVLEIVSTMQKQHGFQKVHEVHLLVGEMAGIEPESLLFCFDAVTVDTICAGAKLMIQTAPLIGCCCDCLHEFPVTGYKFICPVCASNAVSIVSGRELKVDHLEVD